jgi:hypothetical protein
VDSTGKTTPSDINRTEDDIKILQTRMHAGSVELLLTLLRRFAEDPELPIKGKGFGLCEPNDCCGLCQNDSMAPWLPNVLAYHNHDTEYTMVCKAKKFI